MAVKKVVVRMSRAGTVHLMQVVGETHASVMLCGAPAEGSKAMPASIWSGPNLDGDRFKCKRCMRTGRVPS